MNKSNLATLTAYSTALLVSGLAAIYQVMQAGAEAENLRLILRLTARFAFLMYLVVFVARPLHQLWPSPLSRNLLRNRRLIGVAFAGVMTTHLVFIGWLWIFVIGKPISPLAIVGGGGAYLLMLLMLITSFDRPARVLGPRNWRRLHKTGLYWMGAVFASTIVPDIIADSADPYYITVGLLALAAIAVRTMTFFKRIASSNNEPAR